MKVDVLSELMTKVWLGNGQYELIVHGGHYLLIVAIDDSCNLKAELLMAVKQLILRTKRLNT